MRFAETGLDRSITPLDQPISVLARPVAGLTTRDFVAIVFRQKRIVLISFVLAVLIIIFSGLLTPQYQSQMEILVRRERLEPVMSSEINLMQPNPDEVSEEELNSEVELLNSEDLLQKVVVATGLQNEKHFAIDQRRKNTARETDIAKAIEHLRSNISVSPLHKTNVISVSFEAPDPKLATRVLKTLAASYVEKHLEVHRPTGEFTFFDQQTERYRTGLKDAEARLQAFNQGQGITSADLERDLAVQKVAEFNASYEQTQAQIAETGQRIQSLEQMDRSIPTRQVTQVRTYANAELMQQMKSTLLNLNLKRTELLTKYDPSYRLVQEIDKQIADTNAAIATEESSPIRDETIDQSSTHEWVKAELTKAQTDLAGLKAKAAANDITLNKLRTTASRLQEASVVQQDLQRAAKTQEENYLLYLHKEEQARINDALDQTGILNVAIAEEPTAPVLPVRSPLPYALLSVLLAGVGSLTLAVVCDFFNPSFRTPSEITAYLGAPVLASIPKNDQIITIE